MIRKLKYNIIIIIMTWLVWSPIGPHLLVLSSDTAWLYLRSKNLCLTRCPSPCKQVFEWQCTSWKHPREIIHTSLGLKSILIQPIPTIWAWLMEPVGTASLKTATPLQPTTLAVSGADLGGLFRLAHARSNCLLPSWLEITCLSTWARGPSCGPGIVDWTPKPCYVSPFGLPL